ncbi:type II 3-dehydroquinate dehydratase [Cryomorpha ignava]|uniref:3-dehydroquinate dehydratase n=1 Tax=Cryomorpha ignava TaxID=101383 RepID=A0A7K3WS23_9FLAO|nr:type II 3-dehydroquinate dehydratase [Cryomorpha ignava]NEN24479.1 type II 3-dehydroquinate dehydratase [Cryomorpha ignava]
MKNILVINGPNLNLLGKREPVLYGSQDFSEVLDELKSDFPDCTISYFQSNNESELINALHAAADSGIEGAVFNPAAFTHTSIALADAVAAIDLPVVEVHISNIYGREDFRQKSYISKYAAGVIAGFGVAGYRLAVSYLVRS